MDPVTGIGLAASIVGLLALTKPLIKQLGPTSCNKQDLNRMILALIAVKRSYQSLQDFLEVNNNEQNIIIGFLDEPETQCREALLFLREKLENQGFVARFILGKRWDGKLDKCLKILENARASFDLAIQIDQFKTSSIILKEFRSYTEASAAYLQEVRSLIDSNNKFLLEATEINHAEVMNWHGGHAIRLEGITDEITTLKIHSSSSAARLQDTIQVAGDRLAEMTSDNHTETKQWHAVSKANIDRVAGGIKEWKVQSQVAEDHDLRDQIVSWLCNTNPQINQEAAVKKHQDKTGSWFTAGKEYENWLNDTGFIWLNGSAGCGKTILCSSIIESTREYCKSSLHASLACFYFSFTDTEKQKASNFIRSILGQFIHAKAIAPLDIKKLYKDYKHSTPPLKELLSTLETVLQLPGENFLIIDALDECPINDDGRDELCEYLRSITNLDAVHMLATSRRDRDLEESLSGSEKLRMIPIRNAQVDADIELYIRSQLETNVKFRAKKWLEKVKDDILKALREGSQGMFRWAFCQLESLKRCRNVLEVHETLKSLPKTLDETYARMLQAIADEDQHKAIRCLQWLAFSIRPLTIRELAETVIIDPSEQPSVRLDYRFEDPLEVLTLLSSLVTFRTQARGGRIGGKYGAEDAEEPTIDSEILLGHFSIKEYLSSKRLPGSLRHFAVEEQLAHRLICQSCLDYVAHFLQLPGAIPSGHKVLPSALPLLNYARIEWTKHKNEFVLDERYLDVIYQSLMSASWQSLWQEIPGNSDTNELLGCREPLAIAVYLNLYELCARLIKEGASPNDSAPVRGWPENLPSHEYAGEYPSCLTLAIKNQNKNIAEMLIAAGSNVNNYSVHWYRYFNYEKGQDRAIPMGTSTPLREAISTRRLDLVQLLLDSGASTTAPNPYPDAPKFYNRELDNRTALQIVEDMEQWDIFHALERSPDVDQDHLARFYAGQPYWPSQRGIRIKQQLVQAIEDGNMKLVDDLIRRYKIDINLYIYAKDRFNRWANGTMLSVAVRKRDVEIVQELLRRHAKVEHEELWHENPLQIAIRLGFDDMLILLLEATGKTYLNRALYYAITDSPADNAIATIRLLLDRGADPQSSGHRHRGCALQEAADLGERAETYPKKTEIMKVLLEHGADPNPQGLSWHLENTASKSNKQTPLQLILLGEWTQNHGVCGMAYDRFHSFEIVRLLLTYGALIHPAGDEEWSSLQRILVRLPKNDLLFNPPENLGLVSCDFNREELSNRWKSLNASLLDIVSLLLEHGARLEPIEDPGLSAAYEAKDFRRLAELLLKPMERFRSYNYISCIWDKGVP